MNTSPDFVIISTRGLEVQAKELHRALSEMGTKTSLITDLTFIRGGNAEWGGGAEEQLLRDKVCLVITSGPGNAAMMWSLQMALMTVAGFGPRKIYVISAYQPMSRSEKPEKRPDGKKEHELTGGCVKLIEAAAFGMMRRMVVVDPHTVATSLSTSRPGIMTQVSVMKMLLTKAIEQKISLRDDKDIVVHFPDGGARDRFDLILAEVVDDIKKRFDVNIYHTHGEATRFSSTRKEITAIRGQTDKLDGAHVISADDEGATLGTNERTALKLRELGHTFCSFTCVFVHAVLYGDRAINNLTKDDSPIDGIITTDTIPFDTRKELQRLVESERIEVVTWIPMMARVAKALLTGGEIPTEFD